MEVAVGTEFGLMAGSLSDAHLAESVAPGVTLFAVADGFGEIGRGPTAPLALATVRDYLRRRNRVGSLGRNVSPGSLRSILLAALVLARPVRALLAVLVIVAMLLGGAYVVRTGYPDRSASVTSADR
ncbi:MAG: hypothetical protein NVS4B5_12300 [Vulcanimicrobiaceae bacterium]